MRAACSQANARLNHRLRHLDEERPFPRPPPLPASQSHRSACFAARSRHSGCLAFGGVKLHDGNVLHPFVLVPRGSPQGKPARSLLRGWDPQITQYQFSSVTSWSKIPRPPFPLFSRTARSGAQGRGLLGIPLPSFPPGKSTALIRQEMGARASARQKGSSTRQQGNSPLTAPGAGRPPYPRAPIPTCKAALRCVNRTVHA